MRDTIRVLSEDSVLSHQLCRIIDYGLSGAFLLSRSTALIASSNALGSIPEYGALTCSNTDFIAAVVWFITDANSALPSSPVWMKCFFHSSCGAASTWLPPAAMIASSSTRNAKSICSNE